MTKERILFLGGARSDKRAFGERLAGAGPRSVSKTSDDVRLAVR